MSTFTEAEREYLGQNRLGRVATVGRNRTPARDPGRTEALSEPQPLIRIQPDRVISWGLGE